MPSFALASAFPGIGPDALWQAVTSPAGVNYELVPFLRMTFPAGIQQLEDLRSDGSVQFVSTLLLFKWLPLDRHRFALLRLEPGQMFDERSSNLALRRWRHQRSVEESAGATILTDICELMPRLPGTGLALGATYRHVFRHRHRRLRARYKGGPAAAAAATATMHEDPKSR